MMKNDLTQKRPRLVHTPETQPTEKSKVSRHAVLRSWCPSGVKGRGVGVQHRVELVDPDEED